MAGPSVEQILYIPNRFIANGGNILLMRAQGHAGTNPLSVETNDSLLKLTGIDFYYGARVVI